MGTIDLIVAAAARRYRAIALSAGTGFSSTPGTVVETRRSNSGPVPEASVW